MKVLLDENVPHDLRPFLRHHDTFTVVYAGFAGLKNGALLDAAEKAAFDDYGLHNRRQAFLWFRLWRRRQRKQRVFSWSHTHLDSE